MYEMVKNISDARIYCLPKEAFVSDHEFPQAPKRWEQTQFTPDDLQKSADLNQRAQNLGRQLSSEQIELAKQVIGEVADVWQMVEDGLIDEHTLMGKYHSKFLRIIHMVELIRRFEEIRIGGNYGHGLLRMREHARAFHYQKEKYRGKSIFIYLSNADERIVVIPAREDGEPIDIRPSNVLGNTRR
ncbi:hypothetical protein ACFP81_08625 [Deinococcus lacus]|uniref:Uncharacterized protein n=1 Tax=Deinococcus lacus TaxID=392561 RepID=A0ABW1YD89_9DEIO